MTVQQIIENFIFKFRRGPASLWASKNSVLRPGEPGIEADTNRFKLGDGSTPWTDLPAFIDENAVADLISASPGGGSDDGFQADWIVVPLADLGVPVQESTPPSGTRRDVDDTLYLAADAGSPYVYFRVPGVFDWATKRYQFRIEHTDIGQYLDGTDMQNPPQVYSYSQLPGDVSDGYANSNWSTLNQARSAVGEGVTAETVIFAGVGVQDADEAVSNGESGILLELDSGPRRLRVTGVSYREVGVKNFYYEFADPSDNSNPGLGDPVGRVFPYDIVPTPNGEFGTRLHNSDTDLMPGDEDPSSFWVVDYSQRADNQQYSNPALRRFVPTPGASVRTRFDPAPISGVASHFDDYYAVVPTEARLVFNGSPAAAGLVEQDTNAYGRGFYQLSGVDSGMYWVKAKVTFQRNTLPVDAVACTLSLQLSSWTVDHAGSLQASPEGNGSVGAVWSGLVPVTDGQFLEFRYSLTDAAGLQVDLTDAHLAFGSFTAWKAT